MGVTVRGSVYDFAAECLSCGDVEVFSTKAERQKWVVDNHYGHKVDFYLQGRV
jgi:hypothetical protein